jgi:hypothetical protein
VAAPAPPAAQPAPADAVPAPAVSPVSAPVVPPISGQSSGTASDAGPSRPPARSRTRSPGSHATALPGSHATALPGSHATALSDPGARSPAAEPGRLKINLLPYARVTVDGQPRGQTPVDLALPAGAHQLALENPDTGQRSERRIDIAPGQTLVIHHW